MPGPQSPPKGFSSISNGFHGEDIRPLDRHPRIARTDMTCLPEGVYCIHDLSELVEQVCQLALRNPRVKRQDMMVRDHALKTRHHVAIRAGLLLERRVTFDQVHEVYCITEIIHPRHEVLL